MIHCANPKAQYLSYKGEIDSAMQRVLESGTYILGEEVAAFEGDFAQYLGAGFAIGCGSGTDALVLAMRALDICPGDEVVVPSLTAVPTVAAVVMAGATPVYVDIEPDYFTIDPIQVEAACTDKTKAIIAVHLYGQSAAMDDLMKIAKMRNIRVIEDCAQATGASYRGKKLGTIGDIGCFSFFPTKNLGAIGDGGAVVCHDAAVAARIRRLRQYGWDENRISTEAGVNSRLDEMQAAILRVKLKHLESDNAMRRIIAKRYSDAIVGLPLIIPILRSDSEHVYHLYVVQTEDRKDLMAHLQVNGIMLGIHYPVLAHQMPAFVNKLARGFFLHHAERLSNRVLSLPIYPEMNGLEVEKVISSTKEFFL